MTESNTYLTQSEAIQYLKQHGLDLTPREFLKFREEHQLRAHIKKDQNEGNRTIYILQSDLDIILAALS